MGYEQRAKNLRNGSLTPVLPRPLAVPLIEVVDPVDAHLKKVGGLMPKKVFAPGKTMSWNQLTKHATGEELNAKAFAADFRGR